MGYKDLAVHLEQSPECSHRVDVAIGIAQAHDAHLTGIYIDPGLSIPAFPELPSAATEQLIVALRDEQDEAEAAVRSDFEGRAERAGVRFEWRTTRRDLDVAIEYHAALAEYCRYCDLVVVGQTNPDSLRSRTGIADSLVLDAGRPVLVVPYIGVSRAPGAEVLVAWNNSKQSARAVNDAIPMLQRAERVAVLVGNPDTSDALEGALPGVDISQHLARHDVKTEVHRVIATDIDIGDLILSRAADMGVDMIVMGGYGHSRLRELVLGGATRQLLRDMTVPVLMSH